MKNWQAAREIRTQIGVIDADLGFLKNWLPCLDGEVAVTATITPGGALRAARKGSGWTSADRRVVVMASQRTGRWRYDVGTPAQSLVKGSSVAVTGVLQRLLRGERVGAPPAGEGRAA